MVEINDKIIFVKGAKNGAIYNFNDNKVYSINSEGCETINAIINNDINSLSSYQKEFIETLTKMGIYNKEFNVRSYVAANVTANLEMVWLEITQACNLRCLHCYEGNNHCSTKNKIDIKRWMELIDEISDIGISRVVVIGGEPCVSNNLMKILEKLCVKGIKTTLFTNATVMSEELLSFVIENKEFIEVKVSVYGHNSEIHDKVTQVNGSFDLLYKNTKWLADNNVRTSAAVVIMKENEKYIEDIIGFVKGSHLRYTRYDVIRNVFGGNQNEHTVTDKKIISKVMRMKPNFKISQDRFNKAILYNSCWQGKITITENGDVYPCVFERQMVLGNVEYNSIKTIMNSEKLQKCWNCTWSQISVCKDCEYRFACKDCRPLAKSVNGNNYNKNPRCTYNPYEGKWEKI